MTNKAIYHLHYVDETWKKMDFIKLFKKLRKSSDNEKKIIVLTKEHLTADELSFRLNLEGIVSSSIHNFKSLAENDILRKTFNAGNIEVLVTNKLDILLNESRVLHIVNYDMLISDIKFFEYFFQGCDLWIHLRMQGWWSENSVFHM